jgi:hypothetical protein
MLYFSRHWSSAAAPSCPLSPDMYWRPSKTTAMMLEESMPLRFDAIADEPSVPL